MFVFIGMVSDEGEEEEIEEEIEAEHIKDPLGVQEIIAYLSHDARLVGMLLMSLGSIFMNTLRPLSLHCLACIMASSCHTRHICD